MRNFLLILCIFSIISNSYAIPDLSFKKFYNYIVPPHLHQIVVYEEYSPKKANMFTLKNKHGNVLVKTDDKKDKIFLKATKKHQDPQMLNKVTFSQKITDQEITIEANYNEQSVDGRIDFELILPQKMALNASTIEGDIFVKDFFAPLRANSTYGNIDIYHAHNSIDVLTCSKGSITLHQPTGRAKAQTNNGTITIYNAQGSVIANTNYGAIEMFAKEVSSTSTIKLTTVSGQIMLHLPADVNADLQASTKKGVITCDHYITLKPQTTQLNKNAWKRLQKEVDGTLGSGEAQIKLSSVKSNIKVLEKRT